MTPARCRLGASGKGTLALNTVRANDLMREHSL